MLNGKQNTHQINNFLDLALESRLPDPSFLERAYSVFQDFEGREKIHAPEHLSILKLQLLFQKLGVFEFALSAREMISNVIGLDEITKSRIQVDNATVPESLLKLVPLMKSKNDARAIYSFFKLNETLGQKSSRSISLGFSLENSSKYLRRISGKKVAIVGPGRAKIFRGAEIDKHDIVVRINVKGDDSLPDSKSHGSRTDVIYLNGVWTDNFAIQNYQRLLERNCHFVWRTKKRNCQILNSHSLTSIDNLELSGSFLMLPRIVFDLLQFNPESITIYHNDFYAGMSVYEENFKSRRNAQTIWDLADHDLLTSLKFMNLIMLKSKISINFTDLEFGENTLDLKKYSNLIQRRYKS
jgi:hypothetical protein